MTFYTGLAATAESLIASKGQSVTLTKRTPGAYNPATGAAAVTETATTETGVVLDYPQHLVDGAMIKRGDKKVLMIPSVDPAPGDTLTIGSVVNSVIDAKVTSPGGTAVLWTVQVRA